MELEPEILGDKGQWCVLCCADLVPGVLLEGVAVLVLHFFPQGHVEVERPVVAFRFVVAAADLGRCIFVIFGQRGLVGAIAGGTILLTSGIAARLHAIQESQSLRATALDRQLAGCPSCPLSLDLGDRWPGGRLQICRRAHGCEEAGDRPVDPEFPARMRDLFADVLKRGRGEKEAMRVGRWQSVVSKTGEARKMAEQSAESKQYESLKGQE